MHSIQTSGNCIRNTTIDEYAGAAPDEVVDPRIYAEIIRQWSTLHPEFTWLPRKFKVAITGATQDRAAIQIHDVGLQAKRNAEGEIGFEVWVGGGLGRTPLLATKLRDWVPEDELLAYLEAVIRVYNALGQRENIHKARIKILVRDLGEEYRERVEAEFARLPKEKYRLDPEIVDADRGAFRPAALRRAAGQPAGLLRRRWTATPNSPPGRSRASRAHKAPGYASVTISLKPIGGIPGDASAEQMEAVAALAERHSFGEIRVTHVQNLVLPHVRQEDLLAVWQGLRAAGLATPNIGLISDIIACPGMDYCALATARSIPVAQMISERFASLDRQLDIGECFINISGCINACGHHHVGHIGILGVDKRGAESYQITSAARRPTTPRSASWSAPASPTTRSPMRWRPSSAPTSRTATWASASSTPIAASASRRSRRRSMPLLEDGRLVADEWVAVADDAPLPDAPAILSPGTAARRGACGAATPRSASPSTRRRSRRRSPTCCRGCRWSRCCCRSRRMAAPSPRPARCASISASRARSAPPGMSCPTNTACCCAAASARCSCRTAPIPRSGRARPIWSTSPTSRRAMPARRSACAAGGWKGSEMHRRSLLALGAAVLARPAFAT